MSEAAPPQSEIQTLEPESSPQPSAIVEKVEEVVAKENNVEAVIENGVEGKQTILE